MFGTTLNLVFLEICELFIIMMMMMKGYTVLPGHVMEAGDVWLFVSPRSKL